ncbi:MAG: N-6 DNA methylase [Planctomycetaceae bacterium]|jgi:hypothetical protein|nr:N-6 DNA methylase [Planctomycetaceae bacterium]
MPDIFVKKRSRQIEIKRQELCDKFYLELRNWYFWATEKSRNPDYSLRLIIRLLICFFLQDKELMPKELFDENFINDNLKSDDEFRYYNAILRNLFFNCLNAPIKNRNKFEHKKLIKNIRNIKDQFNKIPFLNCGLFYEIDGDEFLLHDEYFFCEPTTRHILELDGNYKVAGIIKILSQYKYKLSVDDLFDLEYSQTVDPEFTGKVFESLLVCIDADSKKNRRKITGSFYTPRKIVDYMVNETLDSYLQNYSQKSSQNNLQNNLQNDSQKDAAQKDSALLQCKIIDPACGSGAFPCGVMNEIMRRLDPDKKLTQQERYHKKLEILQNVIYGVDIQPIAVQITILRLFLSLIQEIVPDKKKNNFGVEPLPNLETKFICADALTVLTKENQGLSRLFGVNNGFNIVIGNPPYVNVKHGINQLDKQEYIKNYKTAIRQFDLFTLFIEKAIELGEHVSFIVPKPLINNENYELIRSMILASGLKNIVVGSGIFENAGVESCIFLTSQNAAANTSFTVSEIIDNKIIERHKVNIDFCKKSPFNMICTEISADKIQHIFEKMNQDVILIRDILDITRGIEAGKADDSIIRTKNNYKLLRGEDITKYTCSFANLFCAYDNNNMTKFKPLNIYFSDKIFVRRVANEVIATFDENKYLTLNSVYCCLPKNNLFDLKFLTGILNSKLINFWFKNLFVLTDKLFPYLRKSQLKYIPVKNIVFDRQQSIIKLVNQILLSKTKNPTANTTKLESNIDRLIYELYDLTEDEIKIVEG